MKLLNVEWKWTVPNALSLLRLALVPVIAVTYLLSEQYPELLYVALGALLLSGLTDSLDGIIARRFHQITDMGKLLDPLADKLTQVVVVVCLTVRYPQVLPLLIICVGKELCQAVGGLLLLRRGGEIRGAKWFGKVSTFLFYGVMAAIVVFPDMPDPLFIGLLTLVSAAMLFAFINYLRMFLTIRRETTENTETKETNDAE